MARWIMRLAVKSPGTCRLYDYVLQRLTEANLHNDRAALDESLQLLGEIDSAWNAIPQEQRRPAAVAP